MLATVSSDSVLVGQPVELDFTLTLTPDPGFSGANFTGGAVELFSGQGAQHTFFLFGPGGTTKVFSWDVSYSSPGNYTPSYGGIVFYTEDFSKLLETHHCRGPGPCAPRYEVVTIATFQILHGEFVDPAVNELGVSVAAAAPELSTWAMLLLGFAGIGFMAQRRRGNSIAVNI